MITTKAEVTGMMCPMCEKHVVEAIENNFDVAEVTASKDANEVVIKSAEALDEGKLSQVIDDEGYTFVKAEVL